MHVEADRVGVAAEAWPFAGSPRRWLSDENGTGARETVKFLADPCTFRLLIAVAWMAVRPVVPTCGNSNWNPAGIVPCVADTMSKLRTTPLIMNCTDGVVSGAVGIVVAVLSKTRLVMLFRKIDGCMLERRIRQPDRIWNGAGLTEVSICASIALNESVPTPP